MTSTFSEQPEYSSPEEIILFKHYLCRYIWNILTKTSLAEVANVVNNYYFRALESKSFGILSEEIMIQDCIILHNKKKLKLSDNFFALLLT